MGSCIKKQFQGWSLNCDLNIQILLQGLLKLIPWTVSDLADWKWQWQQVACFASYKNLYFFCDSVAQACSVKLNLPSDTAACF